MKCRDFQFEVGKRYEAKGTIKLCENGFHYHKNKEDLFEYYSFDEEKTIVCEIEAYGENIDSDDKSVCEKIFIKKRLS